jgi:hypothetical protein
VSRDEPRPEDLAAFARQRLERYVELWDSASTKLSRRSYHAEDLVDDSLRWVGMLAQDATAAATLILRAASGAAQGRAPGTSERGSSRR